MKADAKLDSKADAKKPADTKPAAESKPAAPSKPDEAPAEKAQESVNTSP